ncbi:MAG: response regulator transcription factor [Bacteroidales bacterium]|nr:response regulator transcription factor [Bacteroidales bacterium]
MTKILYVEDELFLGRIVSESLEKSGFEVYWEKDGALVQAYLDDNTPDICVLDIMLPNVDGYTLCRKISAERPGLPIIFLTAKTETKDILKGFEAGGTDYVRKPFSMDELIARINNQLKIAGTRVSGSITGQEIKIGKYVLHTGRYELLGPDGIKRLSQRDMQVLGHLLANINGITDRRQLLLEVWGDDSFFNSRNLDVYIRKIRDYFSADISIAIKTLKGKGYLFIVP